MVIEGGLAETSWARRSELSKALDFLKLEAPTVCAVRSDTVDNRKISDEEGTSMVGFFVRLCEVGRYEIMRQ